MMRLYLMSGNPDNNNTESKSFLLPGLVDRLSSVPVPFFLESVVLLSFLASDRFSFIWFSRYTSPSSSLAPVRLQLES